MESESVEQMIKEKRKSKGRRRSSFADEALRLINMSGYQAEEQDQRQLLEAMIDTQYDFIQEHLKVLRHRMNQSSKMAEKSASLINKTIEESNNKLNFTTTCNLFEKPKGYDLLTKEHKQFLDSHDINEEYVKKFLKELKNRKIAKAKATIKENEKMMENRQFLYFKNKEDETKRISRSSRSSLQFGSSSFVNNFRTQTENRDMIDIALEYFNTKYGDE